MQIQNAVLHLFSAIFIALVGGVVCLWALLSKPRIRWDRFWIGLALLLLVAPIAFVVTAVRMRMNEWDETLDGGAVVMDTTYEVGAINPADSSAVVDTASEIVVDPRGDIVVDTVSGVVVDTVGGIGVDPAGQAPTESR